MTKEQKDNLFVLIKSLSKSEKRQFKLYVGRLGVNEDSKFLMLFNILEKLPFYDESTILKKGVVKKQQLSNLKAHLYKQILISLRLNPSHQNIRIQIREQLDFATILYHKGLYKQSLKILDKAKSLAIANEEKNIAYEIVELEKVIESQYITRSISSRADELTIQAKELSQQNVLASKLSNLSLQLYGLFLKTGYTKEEMKLVRETKKILNDNTIAVTATAVRIPVVGGHSESINIEFNTEVNVEDIVKLLSEAPGVVLKDDPANGEYPMPLYAHGKDDVFVGRIRLDESQPNTINMWVVSDNLRKGAATNTIQIAEYLLKNKLI